jgi:hypothetical protein
MTAMAVAAVSTAGCTLCLACASKAPVHPPELGDCIPTQDASCADPGVPGAGGPTPGGDAGAREDAGGQVPDASACGSAATLIATAKVGCLPCIENQANCCIVDLACSIDSGCLALLACAESCASGDVTCLGNCENQWPAAVTTYDDFAMCIAQNCYPVCPLLPQTTVSDR